MHERASNGRLSILGALMRRVMEIRNEDAEIALRHAFAIRYPQRHGDPTHHRERSARIHRLVRRNLSADTCVKMLLKPLELPRTIQPRILYPLAAIARRLFFR